MDDLKEDYYANFRVLGPPANPHESQPGIEGYVNGILSEVHDALDEINRFLDSVNLSMFDGNLSDGDGLLNTTCVNLLLK